MTSLSHSTRYHRAGGAGRHSRRAEPERFERAGVISDRLVDNIETVVYGKRSEIKLVLTALACDGHVLLEDVPGTAKTVLARAIAGSIEGAIPQRIQCTPGSAADRRDGTLRVRPADPRLRVQARADLRQRRPRRRDQPRDAEDPVGAARGDGRAPGDRRRRHARAAVSVPRSRDGEPDRVRGHVPAAGSAARPLLPAHVARLSRARGRAAGSSSSSASRIRSSCSSPSSGSTRSTSSGQPRSTCTSTMLLHRWVVELVRATRAAGRPSSSGSSVRGSLALERAARAWALSTAGATSCPRTSSGSSRRCSCTASCSRPTSSRARRAGSWPEAIEEFRTSCLELAPRPGSEEDPLFEGGGADPPGLTREAATCRALGLTFPLVPRRRVIGLRSER